MPLASMSKVTSTCGTPRGAGAMPSRWNLPSVLLADAISRSPCSTWISTEGWLSDAVENTWLFEVGIVVLRSINLVLTPPRVSSPSDSGVTSSRTTSSTSPLSTPAWMAAPSATTSSGLTVMLGALPLVRRRARARAARALHEVLGELLELRPRHRHVEVLGAGGVGGDERQVDLGLRRARQLDLRALGALVEALQGLRVGAQVDALVLLELVGQPVDEALVQVVA